jgi:Family of unknown function (DUF5681)
MKRQSKRPPENSRKQEGEGASQKGQSGNPATQFKAGQSGNPGGHPRKFPTSDLLREVIAQPCARDRAGRPWAEVLASALFEQVRSGDLPAFKEILDRVEGKAVNRVELSGIGGEEIKATVNAKLSTNDLPGAIDVICGLNRTAAKEAEPNHIQ